MTMDDTPTEAPADPASQITAPEAADDEPVITLDQFIAGMRAVLEEFETSYRKNMAEDPREYPIEQTNSSWGEELALFVEDHSGFVRDEAEDDDDESVISEDLDDPEEP